MKVNVPYSILRAIVASPEYKNHQQKAEMRAVKRANAKGASLPLPETSVQPVAKTSWGFPLMAGEVEVANHLIKDAQGCLWIVNDAQFKGSEITVQVKHDGKIINQKVYTDKNWFKFAKQVTEADFEAKHNQHAEVYGFMIAGTKDKQYHYHVYDKMPKHDNLNGKNAIYKVRATIENTLQDSCPVFYYGYDCTAVRAQNAANNVPFLMSRNMDEQRAVLQALAPCVRGGR